MTAHPLDDVYKALDENTEKWIRATNPVVVAQMLAYAASMAQTLSITNNPTPVTSFDIGLSGEDYIINMLKKYLHERIICKITNVAQTSKSGDIIIETANSRVLVEIKNYKTAVPTTEVEKFIRDLNRSDVDGGIFISLKTPISKISQSYLLRYENINSKLKPVIYISANSEDVITAAIETILVLIDRLASSSISMDKLEQIRTNFTELESRVATLAKLPVDYSEIHSKINQFLRSEFDMLVNSKCRIIGAVDSLRASIFEDTCFVSPTTSHVNIADYVAKYDQITKDHITAIITCITEKNNQLIPAAPTNESDWVCLKTQISHTGQKITIVFTKTPVITFKLNIDSDFLVKIQKEENFYTIVFQFINITAKSLNVDINEYTLPMIKNLIATT